MMTWCLEAISTYLEHGVVHAQNVHTAAALALVQGCAKQLRWRCVLTGSVVHRVANTLVYSVAAFGD